VLLKRAEDGLALGTASSTGRQVELIEVRPCGKASSTRSMVGGMALAVNRVRGGNPSADDDGSEVFGFR
jgi:hypothetical protein